MELQSTPALHPIRCHDVPITFDWRGHHRREKEAPFKVRTEHYTISGASRKVDKESRFIVEDGLYVLRGDTMRRQFSPFCVSQIRPVTSISVRSHGNIILLIL